jgi:hypothetical protein
MNLENRSSLRPAFPASLWVVSVLSAVFACTVLMCSQQAQAQRIGFPEDWSHHHVVFSNPGTFRRAIENGAFEKWDRIANDPRFVHQQMRRNAAVSWPSLSATGVEQTAEAEASASARKPKQEPIKKDWSMTLGSGAKVGAGQYPAKFSFGSTTAFCDSDTTPDFVIFNTGLAGTSTQPSIIAYDNLYSGCSGTNKPLVYWQYNTAAGTIPTSVVLSADGKQVAFVQTVSNVASLVLLKWAKSATISTPSSTAAGSYRNCTAPCMTTLALSGNPNDTNSAPFYDYANDVAYVGDDSGVLHKFQNIFNSGTPSEITGGGTSSGWPVTISTNKLTSPIFDNGTSQKVFVGDSGGFLYSEPAGGGSSNKVTSTRVAFGPGIVDAPLVDPVNQTVYVFVGQDGNSGSSSPCTGVCNGVFQFPTTFTGSTGLIESVFGISHLTAIYDGTFDNKYFTNPSTGNIYACGSTGTGAAKLLNAPVSGFASAGGANWSGKSFLATNDINPLTSAAAVCSPVTEILNGTTDLIFLSVSASGTQTGCSGACVYSFTVTSSSPTSATSGLATTSGASGIIIDNTATTPAGASEAYFSTLGNQSCAGNGATGNGTGGCAVQASQAALH